MAQNPGALSAEQVRENSQQARQSYIETEAGQQVTQGQLGLSYHRNTSVGLLTVTGYGIYRDLANPLSFAVITIDRLAGGLRSSLEKSFDNWSLKIGGEIKFQRDDRVEYENNSGTRGNITVNQLEKVTNQALFAVVKYTPGSFHMLGSLRYDRLSFATDSVASSYVNERVFHAFSPAAGISYHTGTSTFYSRFSTSFEAPTTTELVNRPGDGNGFNPNLKPEQITSFEIGSRGSAFDHFLEYDISLYKLWIHDLIFPYQLEVNGPIYYRNQGQTVHKGVGLWAAIHPRKNFSLQLSYTLTDAQFVEAQTLQGTSLEGKSVPGVPQYHASVSLQWLPDSFWVELSGQYVSAYPVNNLNTADNDRYFSADFKLSYQWTFQRSSVMLTPFLNINNVFDAQYNSSVVVNASGGYYYEPAPERNWQMGVSIRF